MSARKQYYKGSEYTPTNLIDQEAFIAKHPKVEELFKELCDKWKPHLSQKQAVFTLHEYIHCGADYGIQLVLFGEDRWELRTYEESGYSDGYVLLSGSDFKDVDKFIIGFEPARYVFD